MNTQKCIVCECRYCGNKFWKNKLQNKIIEYTDYVEIVIYNSLGKEVGRAKINHEKVEEAKKYKWRMNPYGYFITKNNIPLHRIVFGKKEGFIVDHINCDPLDNRVENLEWVTASENKKHAFDTGLQKARKNVGFGKSKCRPIERLSITGQVLQVYPSINDAKRDGYNAGNVTSVINNKSGRTQHKGYRWRYLVTYV